MSERQRTFEPTPVQKSEPQSGSTHQPRRSPPARPQARYNQPGPNGLPSTRQALNRSNPGQALPPTLRQRMEQALDRDLSSVRVHTDSQAGAAAQELGAKAFTHQKDIYFGEGFYQPQSRGGQHLIAHETAHTIQYDGSADRSFSPIISHSDAGFEREADAVADRIQSNGEVAAGMLGTEIGSGVIARQEDDSSGAGDSGSDAAETGGSDAPAMLNEEFNLASGDTFTPSETMAAYIDAAGRSGADIRVKLGTIARGTIPVRKRRDAYSTIPGASQGFHPINLTLPALEPLREAGITPVLAVKINNNTISGYVTIMVREGVAGNPSQLLNSIRDQEEIMGWLGFDISRFPRTTNELSGGTLRVQVNNFAFRLGGFITGTGTFGIANDVVTFEANGIIRIENLTEAPLNVRRNEQGDLHARAEIPVTIANFSGNLIGEYGNGTVNIEGTVRYTADKFNGEVTLMVTDRNTARNVAQRALPPDAIRASAQQAAGGGENSEGPRPGPRAIAGFGTLNFAFTEWMTGTAQVIIDNEGHITVVGEIAPPAEVELFPQRDWVVELFAVEVRATYGIPLVGNLFLFANVGLEALAKLGPAKIYNIAVRGRYSTDPNVLQNWELEATLNISAFAGLRLRAEGGAGIELLGHDVKAGVGLNGLAGVRGYVEATPLIGYREKDDPAAGRLGEYFIKGHMELAAQPFLGLSGDLFVELDSPWWSPAPDKKWTWPIGSLEYPLPGEFGIGADVDYVVGSPELPEIQFGEVDFNKDKFMTDLMNDHVPPRRGGGDQDQSGTWEESQTGQAGDQAPQVNESAGGSPTSQPAQGQQQAGEAGEVPATPQAAQQRLGGMQALANLVQQSERDPFTEQEIANHIRNLRRRYPFSVLNYSRTGEDWQITAAMSPPRTFTAQGEAEPAAGTIRRPSWVPEFATDDQVRRAVELRERFTRERAPEHQIHRYRNMIRESGSSSALEQTLSNFESGVARRDEPPEIEMPREHVPGSCATGHCTC